MTSLNYTNTLIADQLKGALRFLESNFDEGTQRWQDFSTRTSGSGTQWITAFVLAHNTSAFTRIQNSWLRSTSQIAAPIGYNDHVPPDCDSTAWALFVLRHVSPHYASQQFAANLSSFVASHWVELNGRCGLSTYSIESPIVQYKKLNGGWGDFRGWTQTPCDEISALGLPLLIETSAEKSIWIARSAQWINSLRRNGVTSYWWTSDAYVIRVTLDALHQLRHADDKLATLAVPVMEQLLDLLSHIARKSAATPFDKANVILAVLSCYCVKNTELLYAHQLLEELLVEQSESGAWTSQSVMRIPHPCDIAPWNSSYFDAKLAGTGGLLSDSGILSTAVCASAFDRFLRCNK